MEEINVNIVLGPKRTNQRISNQIRELIIDKWNSGLDSVEVDEMFGVKPGTVRNINRTFRMTGVKIIQQLFSKWKNDIRRSESQNEDQLYETIHNTSDNITAQNCTSWVRHMESYLPKCLNRDEIYS